ncbi:hypothetical protein CBR_g32240 [Chara braunii]|uniref:F-box domain-containing protein n=1 Tax=Chara braunii TaxID=69332 RepID=A0A388JN99_CHABU|nr:hypothetical protein CBR_g32240 [Chara braunii]|eukprot:GBG59223.1 hypothetical protein CBR_g32240 [Chara braunii]
MDLFSCLPDGVLLMIIGCIAESDLKAFIHLGTVCKRFHRLMWQVPALLVRDVKEDFIPGLILRMERLVKLDITLRTHCGIETCLQHSYQSLTCLCIRKFHKIGDKVNHSFVEQVLSLTMTVCQNLRKLSLLFCGLSFAPQEVDWGKLGELGPVLALRELEMSHVCFSRGSLLEGLLHIFPRLELLDLRELRGLEDMAYVDGRCLQRLAVQCHFNDGATININAPALKELQLVDVGGFAIVGGEGPESLLIDGFLNPGWLDPVMFLRLTRLSVSITDYFNQFGKTSFVNLLEELRRFLDAHRHNLEVVSLNLDARFQMRAVSKAVTNVFSLEFPNLKILRLRRWVNDLMEELHLRNLLCCPFSAPKLQQLHLEVGQSMSILTISLIRFFLKSSPSLRTVVINWESDDHLKSDPLVTSESQGLQELRASFPKAAFVFNSRLFKTYERDCWCVEWPGLEWGDEMGESG